MYSGNRISASVFCRSSHFFLSLQIYAEYTSISCCFIKISLFYESMRNAKTYCPTKRLLMKKQTFFYFMKAFEDFSYSLYKLCSKVLEHILEFLMNLHFLLELKYSRCGKKIRVNSTI